MASSFLPQLPVDRFPQLERAEPPGGSKWAAYDRGFMPSASDLSSSLMGWSAPLAQQRRRKSSA